MNNQDRHFWTPDEIRGYVKTYNIKSRSELMKDNMSCYNAAKHKKLLVELFGERPSTHSWTHDEIREYVKTHNIKTRKELKRDNKSCYIAAMRKKLLVELFGELPFRYSWKTEDDVLNFLKEHPDIKTKMQLRDANLSAYNLARELGLLNRLFKNVNHDWTEENIRKFLKEHPEITTRNKLKTASLGALKAAKKLGILNELLDRVVLPTYSEESILEFLKEHPEIETVKQFREQYPNIYAAANRRHMTQKIFGKRVYKRKYSEEDVRKFVSEHPEITKRSQLRNINYGIYAAALRLKLLDELFGKLPIKNYAIYVYEVIETHSVYVGLTSSPATRDMWHRYSGNNHDSLYNYCQKHNVEIPPIKFIEDDLSPQQAASEEKRIWHLYKDAGWNMINTEGKLGSLGNCSRKWTKKTIVQFLEDHPEIKLKKDFKKYRGPYDYAAYKLKIID